MEFLTMKNTLAYYGPLKVLKDRPKLNKKLNEFWKKNENHSQNQKYPFNKFPLMTHSWGTFTNAFFGQMQPKQLTSYKQTDNCVKMIGRKYFVAKI